MPPSSASPGALLKRLLLALFWLAACASFGVTVWFWSTVQREFWLESGVEHNLHQVHGLGLSLMSIVVLGAAWGSWPLWGRLVVSLPLFLLIATADVSLPMPFSLVISLYWGNLLPMWLLLRGACRWRLVRGSVSQAVARRYSMVDQLALTAAVAVSLGIFQWAPIWPWTEEARTSWLVWHVDLWVTLSTQPLMTAMVLRTLHNHIRWLRSIALTALISASTANCLILFNLTDPWRRETITIVFLIYGTYTLCLAGMLMIARHFGWRLHWGTGTPGETGDGEAALI